MKSTEIFFFYRVLYLATSIGYILLVDDMSISERVEYSTLLSFMVIVLDVFCLWIL